MSDNDKSFGLHRPFDKVANRKHGYEDEKYDGDNIACLRENVSGKTVCDFP